MVEQFLIVGILAVLLFFFIYGNIRYDFVALMGLAACGLLGLIPAKELFSGFGHPATMTVALVLMLSFALTRSGATSFMSDSATSLSKKPQTQLFILMALACVLSMFMNNVGALALIMPVVIHIATTNQIPLGKILMPLSFGSILGGMVTLIGTPPNIIIASYRADVVGTPFQMFDFTPVGLTLAVSGVLFVFFIGYRFLKVSDKTTIGDDHFEIDNYLFQARVTEDSKIVHKTFGEIHKALRELEIEIVSVVSNARTITVLSKQFTFKPGDMVLLEGSQEKIQKAIEKQKLVLVPADSQRAEVLHSKDTEMVEVMIGPGSRLHQRLVESVRFRSYFKVNLLGLYREGLIHRGHLGNFRLKVGDILLLHGEKEALSTIVQRLSCLPLRSRPQELQTPRSGQMALAIFLLSISCAAAGLISLQVAFLIAIVSMIILGLAPSQEIYQNVDWSVVILLGAMIPIGSVLESSGVTRIIAEFLAHPKFSFPDWALLAMLMVITMTLSDVLNNATTTLLMAPIAKDVAFELGVNPDPFFMAVAIGASCAFLTPIGHQNNILVMGPGGYKFSDYWRLGLPLEILIVLSGIPLIMHFWPLHA